jgi:hypothetical protein
MRFGNEICAWAVSVQFSSNMFRKASVVYSVRTVRSPNEASTGRTVRLEDVKEAEDSGECTKHKFSVGRVATTGCQIEGEGEWARAATNNMPIARSRVSHLNAVNAASAQVYKSYLA